MDAKELRYEDLTENERKFGRMLYRAAISMFTPENPLILSKRHSQIMECVAKHDDATPPREGG